MEEPVKEQKIPEKLKIMLIGGSAALVFYIVFATNGTQNVYLHLIYIPIILSAYFWGIKGGLGFALLAGILAGPFMPLNISEGIRQSTANWVSRLIILSTVGVITGALFQKIEKLNNEVRRRDLISPLTGIYNINKLLGDLKKKIDKGDKFKIISIKLTNLVGVGVKCQHIVDKKMCHHIVDWYSFSL